MIWADPLEAIGGSFRQSDWSDYDQSNSIFSAEPSGVPTVGQVRDVRARLTKERKVMDMSPSPNRGVRGVSPRLSLAGAEERPKGAAQPAGRKAERGARGDESPRSAGHIERKPDDTHAPHSATPRVVKARSCKPRPASTKGHGGSRPFVPWCR